MINTYKQYLSSLSQRRFQQKRGQSAWTNKSICIYICVCVAARLLDELSGPTLLIHFHLNPFLDSIFFFSCGDSFDYLTYQLLESSAWRLIH